MGINCGNLILLKAFADASGGDAPLGDLVMYGRLHVTLAAAEQVRITRHLKLSADALARRESEPALQNIGTRSIRSIDVSDYEGCDIVFDLTQDLATHPELASKLCETFDTVLDYGTSEHVFNVAQSLVNAWNLLREGGRYIFDLPVPGWASHGLYQFTPDFFHSVGRSAHFHLAQIMFHEKRGDRVFSIAEFDRSAWRRLTGRRKISAWGVLEKRRPDGMAGPLRATDLRVMQSDIRLAPSSGHKNRVFSAATIGPAMRALLVKP